MKALYVVLALIVLLTLAACGDNSDAQAEQETLESAVQELYDAATRQDFQAIGTYVASDFKGYFGNTDFRGVPGSLAWYNPDAKGGTITVNGRESMVAPQPVVSRSSEVWTIGGNDHAVSVTHAWEKNDAQWEVVHTQMSEYKP